MKKKKQTFEYVKLDQRILIEAKTISIYKKREKKN